MTHSRARRAPAGLPQARLVVVVALSLVAGALGAQPSATRAWDSVSAAMHRLAAAERVAHDVPGIWWAVVEAPRRVLVGASGVVARDSARPAAPDDVVRMGSVTKLVTALALLRRWEVGEVDLDAPIDRLIPELRPTDPFNGVLNLRHVMRHRSGLVREPPVGHLFDTSGVPLSEAVGSLSRTRLLFAPGTRFKYSNAGGAVVGRALEIVTRQRFEDAVRDEVFGPLGMRASSFSDIANAPRAMGEGWDLAGPPAPATLAPLGLSPAGGLRTSVRDMARLALALARGGRDSAGHAFVNAGTLNEMTGAVELTPGAAIGTGLGVFVDLVRNARRVWHDGLVPGFASTLAWMPSDSIAVVVVVNSSLGAPSARRLAQEALRLARGAHTGRPLDPPAPVVSASSAAPPAAAAPDAPPVATDALQAWIGLYEDGLQQFLVGEAGGRPVVRMPTHLGTAAELAGDSVRMLAIYDGESLVAERDARGRVVAVRMNGARFARRALGPESGNQLRVAPVRPMSELRREALAASPPEEAGRDAPVDLVELVTLDRTIKLEVRYATSNNLYGTPFYSQARAFLQRPAAQALVRVNASLKPFGVGVLVHDGYRPWYVTKMFWDGADPSVRPFVADPSKGSKHNRGAAVDLALYDLASGATIPMPSTYDETTIRAYPDFPGGSARERWARDLLRRSMEREGFRVYEYEWWHFDFTGWEHWPILNLPFESLGERR